MAAWVCTGCTAVYAVGAPCCPQCQSTVSVEQGEPMPKITRHGGPTIAGASVVAGAWSDSDAPDVWPALDTTDADDEEVASSPGISSETSSEKPPTSPQPSEPAPRPRARTTGSRSKKARTGSSSAASTDGDQTADTSASEDSSS